MSLEDKTDIWFLTEADDIFKIIKSLQRSHLFKRKIDLVIVGSARALKFNRTRHHGRDEIATTGSGWQKIIKNTVKDFKRGHDEIHFIIRTIAYATLLREGTDEESFEILYDLSKCARICEQLFYVEWNRPDGIKEYLTEDLIDDQFLRDIKEDLEKIRSNESENE
jgi:hypothetical protein